TNIVHPLRAACLKYFGGEPFLLQPGVKTGLKINYRNPIEVGADRIANAVGAVHQFPNTNLIILDLGTANTICAVSADRQYLGGGITARPPNTVGSPQIEIAPPPARSRNPQTTFRSRTLDRREHSIRAFLRRRRLDPRDHAADEGRMFSRASGDGNRHRRVRQIV